MDVNFFLARVAEQAERTEDVFKLLHPVLSSRSHFSPEERNFLSVSFKNLVTPRRTTWRTIAAIEQQASSASNSAKSINIYKAVIEARLHKNCMDIVDVINKEIIPKVEH